MPDQDAEPTGREPGVPELQAIEPHLYEALASRLEQDGCQEQLQALLAAETPEGRNAWHEARERQGQTPGYLQDLERAWQWASQQFAAGGPAAGTALALECRYVLMTSSLHSLAADIPPALICALLSDGHWSPAQGLVAAAQIPDPALRSEALVCLASAGAIPASLSAGLLAAALDIDDEEQRARALLALVRRLPDQDFGLALDAIGHLPGEGQRARALVELAPQLPAAALERVLSSALALRDPASRADALAGIAVHLPAELLLQALSAVIQIEDEAGRAVSIGRLAPHLPDTLCRQALASTWRMRDAAARCEAQVGLAPCLPAPWQEKALGGALECLNQVHHARASLLLAAMAPHLPSGLQERAVALAEAQPDSRSRVSALTALLPHLSPDYREPIADRALRATLLIRSEASRAEAISRLAPHLPAGLVARALSLSQSLSDGRARAAALVGIAPFLDRGLAADALAAARTIQDERACAKALAGIAPLLDTAQQKQALLRVGSLADEKARAIGLVGLAPVLTPGLLPGALADARRIADARALAVALAGVAPAFDDAGRAGILAMAADIPDPGLRLDALLGLLPCLSEAQQAGAFEAGWRAIQALDDERAKVQALARLLAVAGQAQATPQLAPGNGQMGTAGDARHHQVLGEALISLAAIEDPEHRCQALAAIAPYLSAPLRKEALATLPLDGQVPAASLLALMPHLPSDLQSRAVEQTLAALRRLPGPARGRMLSSLVPYLSRQQLGEALAIARRVGDYDEQMRALVALAPALDEARQRTVLQSVSQIAETYKRTALLATLAPHLPEALRREALAMANQQDGTPAGLPAAGGQALGMAPPDRAPRPNADAPADRLGRLPEDAVRSELAAAGSIEDPGLRAQTLSALALRLAQLGLGQEALSATRPIEPVSRQVDALLRLAPYLSLPWLRETLAMARDLGHHGASAAARIAVCLAELGEVEEGWRVAIEIPLRRGQAEALAGLAPHLPAARREAAYVRALQTARDIADEAERLSVMARLLPELPRALQPAALADALRAAVVMKEAAAACQQRARLRPHATPLAALAAPLAAMASEPVTPEFDSALRGMWLAGGLGERLLHLLSRQPRPTTLLDLAVLAPLLARLAAGQAAAGEISSAVRQVARWWP